MIVYGKADFIADASIRIFDGAILEIGEGFFSNANVSMDVNKHIKIGKNALLGWDVQMIDSDGHDIYIDNKKSNYDRDIVVGDDVWIGSRCSLLKGCVIQNGCVLGYGSITSGKHTEEKAIIAGNPAKVIKKDVRWTREKTN